MGDFKIWLVGCTEEEKFQVLRVLENRGVKWRGGETPTSHVPSGRWDYLVRRAGIDMVYGCDRHRYAQHHVEELDVQALLFAGIDFSMEDFMNMIGGELIEEL